MDMKQLSVEIKSKKYTKEKNLEKEFCISFLIVKKN